MSQCYRLTVSYATRKPKLKVYAASKNLFSDFTIITQVATNNFCTFQHSFQTFPHPVGVICLWKKVYEGLALRRSAMSIEKGI